MAGKKASEKLDKAFVDVIKSMSKLADVCNDVGWTDGKYNIEQNIGRLVRNRLHVSEKYDELDALHEVKETEDDLGEMEKQ